VPQRAGHLLKRIIFRTDAVMVLEGPGQPVGDSSRSATAKAGARLEAKMRLRRQRRAGNHLQLGQGVQVGLLGMPFRQC
jgi:hypothetical protein